MCLNIIGVLSVLTLLNKWGQKLRLLAGYWMPALFALLILYPIEFSTNAKAQDNSNYPEYIEIQPSATIPDFESDLKVIEKSPIKKTDNFTNTLEAQFLKYYLHSTGLHTEAESKLMADNIAKLCKQNNTLPEVTLARLMVESNACHYIPGTNKVKRGSHGEYGISQIHPSWINKNIKGYKITRDKLEDPLENIKIGMMIYKRYETDPENYIMAVTHYNSPGCRQPNSYARRVDRKYKEIRNFYRLWAESRFIQETNLKLLITQDYGV